MHVEKQSPGGSKSPCPIKVRVSSAFVLYIKKTRVMFFVLLLLCHTKSVSCSCRMSLFIAEEYSILWIYHSLFYLCSLLGGDQCFVLQPVLLILVYLPRNAQIKCVFPLFTYDSMSHVLYAYFYVLIFSI